MEEGEGEDKVRLSFFSGLTAAFTPPLTAFLNEEALRDRVDEAEDLVDGVAEGRAEADLLAMGIEGVQLALVSREWCLLNC